MLWIYVPIYYCICSYNVVIASFRIVYNTHNISAISSFRLWTRISRSWKSITHNASKKRSTSKLLTKLAIFYFFTMPQSFSFSSKDIPISFPFIILQHPCSILISIRRTISSFNLLMRNINRNNHNILS